MTHERNVLQYTDDAVILDRTQKESQKHLNENKLSINCQKTKKLSERPVASPWMAEVLPLSLLPWLTWESCSRGLWKRLQCPWWQKQWLQASPCHSSTAGWLPFQRSLKIDPQSGGSSSGITVPMPLTPGTFPSDWRTLHDFF